MATKKNEDVLDFSEVLDTLVESMTQIGLDYKQMMAIHRIVFPEATIIQNEDDPSTVTVTTYEEK